MKIEPKIDLSDKTVSNCLNPYSNGMKIELMTKDEALSLVSLNPYSNGMKIERDYRRRASIAERCLNPYSNGMKIEHHMGIKCPTVDES